MFGFRNPMDVPAPGQALPGRDTALQTASTHLVFKRPLKAEPPAGYHTTVVAMGCFWGAERLFWQTPGVWLTAAGYAGGQTPNPTYEETCSGRTGHAEAVKIVFNPARVSFETLLKLFWENHDPTQGMRQGNDVGTQYRSAIFTLGNEQAEAAIASRARFAAALAEAGRTAPVTTEIAPLDAFYYAEADHQQYLARHPNGYCGLAGTGVACPGAPAKAD